MMRARHGPRVHPAGRGSESFIVSGWRLVVVSALIYARVVWLALRAYRNPGRALRALMGVRAELLRQRQSSATKYARAGGRYFWHLYAPGWPSRAFDRFVEGELDRVVPFRGAPAALQTVLLAVTKRCAFACEHCCEWDELNARESLTRDDLHAVVAQIPGLGTGQVFLTGGEPLLRFEVLADLVAAVSVGADVWVITSGQRLTDERAARLRAAGLTGIVFSLDDWRADRHDRFRGVPGAYAGVERGAAAARRAGLLVAVSLCPTRAFVTEDNLNRYAETARRLRGSFIQILEPKAVGRYAGQDVTLTDKQYRLLEAFYQRLNTDPACREFPKVASPDLTARRVQCFGGGDRYAYIDADGALHSCPFCRSRGVSVLDGRLGAALHALRRAGCPVAGLSQLAVWN